MRECSESNTDVLRTYLMRNGIKIPKDNSKHYINMFRNSYSNMPTLIDDLVCISCNKCFQVCPESVYAETETVPDIIESSYCTDCELCAEVCPVENCITFY